MCQKQLLEKDLSAFGAACGTKTATELLWSSAVCVGSWLRLSDSRGLVAAAAVAAAADVVNAFRI